MRRIAALAVTAAAAGSGFLAAAPAEAFCPLPNAPVVVPCYSLVDNCATVALYNIVTTAPSVTVCPPR